MLAWKGRKNSIHRRGMANPPPLAALKSFAVAILPMLRVSWLLAGATAVSIEQDGLVIPSMSQALTTPAEIHAALEPAWKSLVEERNAAGLVAPKEEGQPPAPLGKEEAAFQYDRVQRGEVDSARLLLVFGLVPSARYLDDNAKRFFKEHEGEDYEDHGDQKEVRGDVEVQLASQRYADGATPLHMAATFGLKGSVRSLLQTGADLKATTTAGVQPLHAAAIAGHAEIVQILVEHGADPNQRHGFAGNSPLHFAAEMGHVEVVRRLCDMKADVEAEKTQGGTALHTAADTNNAAVASVLLEFCGADPEALLLGDTVPLYLAAGRGFPQVIDVLIAAGANPDRTLRSRRKKAEATKTSAVALPGSSPDAPGWEEGNGATPLHNACENGHLSAVKALLEAGARQLNTMEGVTPLITALQYSQPDIALELLDGRTPAQIDVTSPKDGQSALHIAAGTGYPSVAARILYLGGKNDVVDRAGRLPLHYATGPVRWLLHRFHGRDRRLDDIARSYLQQGNLEDTLEQLDDTVANTAKKTAYRKYLLAHHQGTLADEVANLAMLLRQDGGETPLLDFSVARYLLAGASDLPLAIEAMMQETEMSIQVGFTLLGCAKTNVSYEPGKALHVNGLDVLSKVQGLLQAARTKEAAELEDMAKDLRHIADSTGDNSEL